MRILGRNLLTLALHEDKLDAVILSGTKGVALPPSSAEVRPAFGSTPTRNFTLLHAAILSLGPASG
jgi:hypothetical protein